MPEFFGFDFYSPKEIAERVENVGVTKANLPLLSMAALLAGREPMAVLPISRRTPPHPIPLPRWGRGYSQGGRGGGHTAPERNLQIRRT